MSAHTLNRSPVIRVGLIGCGTIGWWQHLPNLRRLKCVDVIALADPDAAALGRAAGSVDAATFPTTEELLSLDGLDAVVIASPAGFHAEHVALACASGKHIYVEKPLAHDAAALATVRARAACVGRVLAVGYNYRFHPACRRLRGVLQAGSIGEVQSILSQFTESVDPTCWPEWRRSRQKGGGVLLDLATHHVDLYRWLLGDELVTVRTETGTRQMEEDSAWLRATTRAGIEVCGYFAHGGSRSHTITAHGTTGVLQVDLHTGGMVMLRDRTRGYGVRARRLKPGLEALLWRSRKRVQPSYDPSHARALRAFIHAIAKPGQRDPDLATFDDGAASLQAILDAAHPSASESGGLAPNPGSR